MASSYGGIGGAGVGVVGSSSVSQLLDAEEEQTPASRRRAGDDQTLPQPFGVRGWSQPVARGEEARGQPSSASVW